MKHDEYEAKCNEVMLNGMRSTRGTTSHAGYMAEAQVWATLAVAAATLEAARQRPEENR